MKRLLLVIGAVALTACGSTNNAVTPQQPNYPTYNLGGTWSSSATRGDHTSAVFCGSVGRGNPFYGTARVVLTQASVSSVATGTAVIDGETFAVSLGPADYQMYEGTYVGQNSGSLHSYAAYLPDFGQAAWRQFTLTLQGAALARYCQNGATSGYLELDLAKL